MEKNKLYSLLKSSYTCSTVDQSNTFAVEYKPNEWTYPAFPGTDLMCFNTFMAAAWYRNNLLYCPKTRPDLVIYECIVKNPRNKGVFTDLSFLNQEFIDRIQKAKKKKKKLGLTFFSYIPPQATIFCSAIKITKRIDI